MDRPSPSVTEHSPPRSWLTIQETAAAAGVHEATLLRWCSRYGLLARRVGGRWRVDPHVLSSVLAGETVGGRRHAAG